MPTPRLRTPLLLAVLVFAVACETKPQGPTPEQIKAREAEQAAAAAQKERDHAWQRTKECAEQTDRYTKRSGLVESGMNGTVLTMGWQNHYSPKYEKCFVRIGYMETSKKARPVDRVLWTDLVDAFEGRIVATCTDGIDARSPYCSVYVGGVPSGDCWACREFMRDRMEN